MSIVGESVSWFHVGEPWMASGICRGRSDTDWFPEHKSMQYRAQRLCSGCPVKSECLEHALAHGENFGIWGARTPEERRDIQRRRRTA